MAKWLKKNLTNIFLAVIVLAGLCLLLYPSFSDWWNSMHQSRAIAAYVETVDAMSQEEIDEILNAAREYNERLWHRQNRWVLSEEEQAEYESLLDVSGNGIMGYINIPVIGVNLPIYHGTEESVLQVATGHLSATSLPVGGPGTHAAISGHRGLPSARLFTDLDQLKVGDIFTVSVLNEVYTYQIEQIVTVVPEDTSQMNLYQGEDLCTLQTCTPYGVNSHRLLLRGRRIEDVDGALMAASEAIRVPNYIVIPAVGIPILFLLLVVALIYFRRRKPKITPEDLKDLLKRK
ncbi:class C sortase [Acutalibacter muris]|uniref:Class C sortase n=1 Tax=Acutalibacter muris TaxID=1796620 RepID=A0A1Z2XQW6_9FIRM|nr:class C sortase [Acutalibacter muris]ANU55938.1 class C sortase [Hungateiclostridiaceae bacterium KB18]ASB40814.1 class C sortase [Acutalibacter muris]QQR30096.1 class C sortase [Acutalibacter muris]